MKNTIGAIAALSLSLALSGPLQAEPPAELAGPMRSCLGCHGKERVSSRPSVPTIAGISAGVHADAMYAYKEGARACEKSKAMCSAAQRLSDEQIEGIAEYFAGLPFVAAEQQTDAAKVARGAQVHAEACEKCHTDAGKNPADDASILSGQWMPYLEESLRQYRAGEREQPEAMKNKLQELCDEDVEALVHFYGSAR